MLKKKTGKVQFDGVSEDEELGDQFGQLFGDGDLGVSTHENNGVRVMSRAASRRRSSVLDPEELAVTDFQMISVLGKGAFGTVQLVERKGQKKPPSDQ